ncbi:hypothetical protein K1T71_001589 [Dendrolimus kikuchii]|uniref:Uncharacterized protein n=1 Tax=Dendrolimus kikuchii TaxID=765133 RepID=A0ACC1DEC3_9NEOP|nr:hypothetical protein K1T71_001589 [Dendrolimus kikuchii]
MICEALQDEYQVETRGKKKKAAAFVFIVDLIIKKIFFLKLAYAFVLWIVIHKAGYFLNWFVSYLKEQKKECPHYHDHHDHYAYGAYKRGGYDKKFYR